jgi:hypothetical protein
VSAELRTEGIAKAFGGVQALEHCTLTVLRARSPA